MGMYESGETLIDPNSEKMEQKKKHKRGKTRSRRKRNPNGFMGPRRALGATASARRAAELLAEYCGDRIVRFDRMNVFYDDNCPEVRQVIRLVGLSLMIELFPSLLQKKAINGFTFLSKAGTLDKFSDFTVEIDANDALRALSMQLTALGLGNDLPLQVINDALLPLKDTMSMNKFKGLMREGGLCLANGALYGQNLARKLKHSALRVSKQRIKKYELLKRCMIRVL